MPDHVLPTAIEEAADTLASLRTNLRSVFAEIIEPFQPENLAGVGQFDYYELVENFERLLITMALELTNGHQTQAAHILNMRFTTLNSKIKRLNIRVPARFIS